jgi:glycosyltransferase involved in cell wall biosynthesis
MFSSRKCDIDLVRSSLFFDEEWYYAIYPDVKLLGADAAEHYLEHGAHEGRNPGPCFDTLEYLAKWPDAAVAKQNPLVHFAKAADFAAHDARTIRDSEAFDVNWYLAQYADVRAEGLDPVDHYVRYGASEKRDPSSQFSTSRYLDENPTFHVRPVNPFAHFIRHGRALDGAPFSAGSTPGADLPNGGMATKPRKLGRKAVFVTHDLNIGGAPKLLLSIARWFQSATDYDVHIVAMANGTLYAEAAAIAPTHIVGQLLVSDDDANGLSERLRSFIGEAPAFTFVNSAAAGHYCKIDPFMAPVFAYIHELRAIADHYQDQLSTLLARSNHVFCGGAGVADFIRSDFPRVAPRTSTRPSFIDKPQHEHHLSGRDKAALRVKLGLSARRKLVAACGVAHWRKQPLLFVRLARTLIVDRKRDVDFAWIGNGEDIDRMKELVAEFGISDRFHFLGHQQDVRPFIAAADVFALTSSEDPFPLVCLEAGATSTPSVVFREATGFTSVIEEPGAPSAGAAVPLNDEGAFSEAVDRLLRDEQAWDLASREIRRRVLRSYTVEGSCAELLVRIREVADLAPRVSIIVPTYNSAAYLKPRLDSLAQQTFRDVEILLFDDASRDESPEIIAAFADGTPLATAFLSEANSGSVFKAWERGIRAATGDFVWLAEADDWCEPDFLERVLQSFQTSGVRLVHGRSIPVDQEGSIAGDWNDLYLDSIVPGLWHKSFCSPAAKEINRSLGRANSIVNASGVVVRRAAALGAIAVAREFKLAGDWAFYVHAAHGGRIAYCHEAVNYHRRHTSSVTASVEGTANYFQELMNVGAIVQTLYGPNATRDAAFRRHIEGEARRFAYGEPLPAGQTPTALKARGPGVLYGVGDLSGGGAQMFAVRFVNRWQATNGSAVLFVVGHEAEHRATRSRIDPMIPVIGPEDIQAEGGLAQVLENYGLDVVLTGHWWADLAVGRLQDEATDPVPWVVVMHGCHESVLESPDSFPGYTDHLARAQKFCSHWVWTADKNRRLFDEGHVVPRGQTQIINGFEPVAPSSLGRADLGLPGDAVVFSLASRAIESKGWFVTLEAFSAAKQALAGEVDIRLQLIGDGPAAEQIRGMDPVKGVTMIPHTDRLADYIAASDVCLLPSWFVGESLPLVLIEFLAQGKPAIVSDIGACGWAIGEGSEAGPAGVVLKRGPDGSVRVDTLSAAMIKLARDKELRRTLADRAPKAFTKFSMDAMVDSYAAVLNHLASADVRSSTQ